MPIRTLQQVIPSIPISDGGGVKLRRSLGQSSEMRLDPFLMLDEFSSENADDYVAGFPDHPHRGFETITYMLDGHMLHQDHLGNQGHLKSGGAQWMTAGRGIIHSEMPQQEFGRMRGFQLWVNLPAAEKMKKAAYLDLQPEEIPLILLRNGVRVKILAGTVWQDEKFYAGPIQGLSTELMFLDVQLPAEAHFTQAIAINHQAFLYPYEGKVLIGQQGHSIRLQSHAAGILSAGSSITVHSEHCPAKFLLLSARPLKEPVVQYGPFVMNTHVEIEQALLDYQSGLFAV